MDNTTQSNNYSSREITHTVDLCDYLRTIPGMKTKTFDLINRFLQPDNSNIDTDKPSPFAKKANAIWEACMGCPEVPDVHFDEPNKGYAIKGRVNPFKRLAYRTKSVDCSEHGQNNIPIISDEFGITDLESRKIITPLWRHESTQALAPLLTLILLRNYTDEKRLCFRVSKKGVTHTCCRDVVADYLSEITPKARYAYTCEKRKSDPLLFSPYMLDIEFWTLICELKMLYEMAKQNLAIRESRNGQALPWDLQEQAVLFSLYNCNPFDILYDWFDIQEKFPNFNTDENYEIFLCFSLATLFSEDIEKSEFLSEKRKQFMTQFYQENLSTISLNEFLAPRLSLLPYDLDYILSTSPKNAAKDLSDSIKCLSPHRGALIQFDNPFFDEPGSAQAYIESFNEPKYIASLNKYGKAKKKILANIANYNELMLGFSHSSYAYFTNLFKDAYNSPDHAFEKLATHFFLESRYVSTLSNDYVPMAKGILCCSAYTSDNTSSASTGDSPEEIFWLEALHATQPFDFYTTDEMSAVSRKFRRSDLLQNDCSTIDFSNDATLNPCAKRLACSYYIALDKLRHTDEGLEICQRCQSWLAHGWKPIWFVFHQFDLY